MRRWREDALCQWRDDMPQPRTARRVLAGEAATQALWRPEALTVQVLLPEGSRLECPLYALLLRLAEHLRVGEASAQAVVDKQLLPALRADPALLGEFVAGLSMDELFLATSRAALNTPGGHLRQCLAPAQTRVLLMRG